MSLIRESLTLETSWLELAGNNAPQKSAMIVLFCRMTDYKILAILNAVNM